jgi:hypothetical protein
MDPDVELVNRTDPNHGDLAASGMGKLLIGSKERPERMVICSFDSHPGRRDRYRILSAVFNHHLCSQSTVANV